MLFVPNSCCLSLKGVLSTPSVVYVIFVGDFCGAMYNGKDVQKRIIAA